MTEVNGSAAQASIRRSLARPSGSALARRCHADVCRLQLARASLLFSRSYPPFLFPLVLRLLAFPPPLLHCFGQCDSCKGLRSGVGFHSNRPSIDPSVGSPPPHWCLVPLHSSQINSDSVRCVAEQSLTGITLMIRATKLERKRYQ